MNLLNIIPHYFPSNPFWINTGLLILGLITVGLIKRKKQNIKTVMLYRGQPSVLCEKDVLGLPKNQAHSFKSPNRQKSNFDWRIALILVLAFISFNKIQKSTNYANQSIGRINAETIGVSSIYSTQIPQITTSDYIFGFHNRIK
ncbi:MAG: hypothetical protein ACPGLV_05855 [Bacteroidia bacterium]